MVTIEDIIKTGFELSYSKGDRIDVVLRDDEVPKDAREALIRLREAHLEILGKAEPIITFNNDDGRKWICFYDEKRKKYGHFSYSAHGVVFHFEKGASTLICFVVNMEKHISQVWFDSGFGGLQPMVMNKETTTDELDKFIEMETKKGKTLRNSFYRAM